jgi:hypothetical protein
MSRALVRSTLKAELTSFLNALPVPVPFYDTIDRHRDITDATWVTATFDAYNSENTCYSGGRKIETGVCDVNVFTDAGGGDAAGAQICDSIVDHFNGFALGEVVVTNAIPPQEFTGGDADRWYGLQVSLEYTNIY